MREYRPGWRSLWCDRRKAVHHRAIVALIIYSIMWPITVVAASEGESITGLISNSTEILLLVGIIQGLISYIYISGQRSTNVKFDTLFKLMNSKLDKEDHDRLCRAKSGSGT
jgi:hypothetical protein